MADLVKLIATAQRLIKANGRAVTFIRHDETLADAAKPWDGPTDARTTPAETQALDAVFVPPASAVRLGLSTEQSDLIIRSEQIMIVSPGTVDLSRFQEVLDDDIYWKINMVEVLKPGPTVLLGFVGVKR